MIDGRCNLHLKCEFRNTFWMHMFWEDVGWRWEDPKGDAAAPPAAWLIFWYLYTPETSRLLHICPLCPAARRATQEKLLQASKIPAWGVGSSQWFSRSEPLLLAAPSGEGSNAENKFQMLTYVIISGTRKGKEGRCLWLKYTCSAWTGTCCIVLCLAMRGRYTSTGTSKWIKL